VHFEIGLGTLARTTETNKNTTPTSKANTETQQTKDNNNPKNKISNCSGESPGAKHS